MDRDAAASSTTPGALASTLPCALLPGGSDGEPGPEGSGPTGVGVQRLPAEHALPSWCLSRRLRYSTRSASFPEDVPWVVPPVPRPVWAAVPLAWAARGAAGAGGGLVKATLFVDKSPLSKA